MSSLLNVTNSRKSEKFKLKDIEVLVDGKEQPWFKRAHIGIIFGIEDMRTSLNGLEKCEMLTRQEFEPTRRTTSGWSGPKDQQNKTDKFLSVYGVMYVIVNSRKDKGKIFREHTLNDIVPHGFDARIPEIQEDHQQTITNRDNQIQAIPYENVALQARRNVYQAQLQRRQDQIHDLIINCHVPRANDPGKDNIVMIIEKNTTPEEDEFYEYPYLFQEYRDGLLTQKGDGLGHNIHIIGSWWRS